LSTGCFAKIRADMGAWQPAPLNPLPKKPYKQPSALTASCLEKFTEKQLGVFYPRQGLLYRCEVDSGGSERWFVKARIMTSLRNVIGFLSPTQPWHPPSSHKQRYQCWASCNCGLQRTNLRFAELICWH